MTLDRARRYVATCLWLLVSATSCASVSNLASQKSCTPRFPYAEGWLGGDAAYSVPLRDGRSVWLFGDSFVGKPGQTTRRDSTFIHNSVAVSECDEDGSFHIDYAWGERADGTPQAFIRAEEPDGYWWLFDGFEHGGHLYIGLLGVAASEPRGSLNLPFRLTGMKLARIENPREPPANWRYEILPLSSSRVAFPGSAMVIDGDHLYLFAFVDRDPDHHPRMLARLPLTALSSETPGEALETLAVDGRWLRGFEPDHARIIMDDDATEMSVRFDRERGLWVAVYNNPTRLESGAGIAFVPDVRFRTATRLEGPWSQPRTIYRIPELVRNGNEQRDPEPFCYAAKEHPQFAREGRWLITYVCNLYTPNGADSWRVLSRLLEQMNLYRPQVVSIPAPDL